MQYKFMGNENKKGKFKMSSQKWWRYRSEEIAPLSERPLVETLPKWLFLVGRNATAPSSPLFVVSSSQSPPNPSSAAWCTLLSAQLQVKPCLANTQCRLLASLPIKYETFFFSRTLLAPNRSSSVYPGPWTSSIDQPDLGDACILGKMVLQPFP